MINGGPSSCSGQVGQQQRYACGDLEGVGCFHPLCACRMGRESQKAYRAVSGARSGLFRMNGEANFTNGETNFMNGNGKNAVKKQPFARHFTGRDGFVATVSEVAGARCASYF